VVPYPLDVTAKQPPQKTPKDYEIPVPKRRDFDQMLTKLLKKKSAARRPKK